MKKHNLIVKLALAIIVGTGIGSVALILGLEKSVGVVIIARIGATFNLLFSDFLSFVVPFLILSFVTVGLATLRSDASHMAVITLVFSYISTIVAGVGAFFVSYTILPGFISKISFAEAGNTVYEPFFTFALTNPFGVTSALVLAFILGISLASFKKSVLLDVIKDFQDIVSVVLEHIIIPLIPLYIASTFLNLSLTGVVFSLVKTFAAVFVLLLLLQALYLIFEYIVASLVCKKNQLPKMRNAVSAYLSALGTQSSAATIPITLECAYKNGIKKEVADFCIPLCATIHLAGDTIAIVVAAVALAFSAGMHVSFFGFLPFILSLGVTMVAAPGVPGGGVMSAHALIESLLGFDTSLNQLMIAIHFAQDSFGTATNVTGDLALAQIIDKFAKEKSE